MFIGLGKRKTRSFRFVWRNSNGAAICTLPLRLYVVSSNICSMHLRHNLLYVPLLNGPLPEFGDRQELTVGALIVNHPDAERNNQGEQLPFGPPDPFAPQEKDRGSQCRSNGRVYRPEQEQCAKSSHGL
jgi:hypothetical protein